MFFLVYFFVFVISVRLLYQLNYGHRNELLSKFPAPKSYPILNHAVLFAGKTPARIFEIFQELAHANGPAFRLDLTAFTSVIVVNDPRVIEAILSSPKLIDKGREYNVMLPFIGEGLLVSNGAKWFRRRKIITPAFHFKILEQFVEIMNKHSEIFVQKLEAIEGQRVDVFPLISLYALDVICESVMGHQINAQSDENSEYVRAVKEICKILFLKIFDLTKRIGFLYRLTSLYKRERELITKLHAFTDAVIVKRRKQLLALAQREESLCSLNDFGMKKKAAFLDLLLQVKVDGVQLSDESIREEVDTFMFEGHDTTTSAIAFALLELAKNPEIQERVFEECRSCQLGTMADLNQLSFLEKVIKETLRLYPSVPNISRRFGEDEHIGDYKFPANVSVRISPFVMGRDPTAFPDPLKFDPSRFDDEKNIRLFSFVPFSAGPRNCIGQKFAMLEMKSILARIVRRFRVTVHEDDAAPILASEIVLRSTNGVVLCMASR